MKIRQKQIYTYLLLFLLAALPLQAQTDEEAREIALIEGFIADGMLQQAVDKVESFLQAYPDSINRQRLQYLQAELYFRLDRFDRAVEEFEQYLGTYTAGDEANAARFLLASAYQFQNNFGGAKRLLTDLLRNGDIDEEMRLAVLRRRASVHMMLGEQRSAREDMERALDISESPEDRLRLAHLYYEMGELRDAERQYKRLLEAGVSDSEELRTVVARYALVRYQQEDYEDVVEFLSPRIDSYRSDEIITGTLAWAYYRLGRYEEAYQVYSSRELPRQTRFEKRLQMARQMLLINEYRAAIQSLTTLESEFHEPELRARALSALADAYEALGDYNSAVKTLDKLAPLVTDSEEAFQLYGQIGAMYQKELGNNTKAIEAYIQALAIDEEAPGVDDIKANLIQAYLERGDRGPALNRMLDFIENHEDSEHFEAILFQAGTIYEANGAFDLALEQYRKIAQLRSNSPYREASYRQAFALVDQLQRWPEIIAIGYEYIEQFPEHEGIAATLRTIAQAEFLQEDYYSGISTYERSFTLLEDKKAEAEVLARIAWGYYKLGELQQAGVYYQRIYDEYSGSPQFEEALYWLGWLANVNNDRETANSHFRTLVEQFPRSEYAEIALFQLGSNQQRAGNAQQALEYYRTILETYPDGDYAAQARINLVELALENGNFQAAVEAMPQFRNQNPLQRASAGNLFEEGNRLAEQGRYQEAIDVFERMRERFPRSELADETLFNLANLHYREENLRQAARELRTLIEEFPESDKIIPAHYLLGQTMMQMRNFAQAADHFKQVLAVNADRQAKETLNYLLGTCYEQSGDHAKAADHYQQFLVNLEDQSEMLPRRMEIAALLLKQGRYQQAIAELQRIITASRDDQMEMNAQYLIGQAYEEDGQLEQAAAEYLKVTYAHSSAPAGALMSRMRAGRIFERLEKYVEAAAIYENIIRNHKGSRFAQVAQMRLDAISGLMQEAETSEEAPQQQ